MKRLIVPLFAAVMFAAPVSADAGGLIFRSIDVSIGLRSLPQRVERTPQVIYVRETDQRRDHRHRSHRQENRRWREEPQVIVIDRGAHRHSCNAAPVVVSRPGTVVVVANDRRR